MRTPSARPISEAFGAELAISDIAILEQLSEARPRAVDLYRREGDGAMRVNLKVFSRGGPLPLSERVPLLENLGFRVVNERTYRIAAADAASGRERLAARHGARACRGRTRSPSRRSRERSRRRLLALFRGTCRIRRLQPPRPRSRPRLARCRHGARARPLPAPGPHPLRAGLSRRNAGAPRRHRSKGRRAVLRPFRPACRSGSDRAGRPRSAPSIEEAAQGGHKP